MFDYFMSNWEYKRSQTVFKFHRNVVEVKDEAFKGCYKLKKVVLMHFVIASRY